MAAALPPLYIEGLAFWSPTLPGWDVAAPALRGEPVADAPVDPAGASAPRRPAPALLAANERRRAPDSVLLALEVAQAAVLQSGRDAATLASVFSSAYGDLPIVDALCRTLAGNPLLLSPTRFHHSVHNAASGYWAIASGSRHVSTALAAGDHSFAAGWLEAAALCAAGQRPVLLVGFDTEACGPLASVNTSRGLLGLALVLAPQATAAARWRVDSRMDGPAAASDGEAPSLATAPQALSPVAQIARIAPLAPADATRAALRALAGNPQAAALPLFEALARGREAQVALALGETGVLQLSLTPLRTAVG
jgi:hypothetical protein